MQKIFMNAAYQSAPHQFLAHHWSWLSRNKVNRVLSSNDVPVIRSLKLVLVMVISSENFPIGLAV